MSVYILRRDVFVCVCVFNDESGFYEIKQVMKIKRWALLNITHIPMNVAGLYQPKFAHSELSFYWLADKDKAKHRYSMTR